MDQYRYDTLLAKYLGEMGPYQLFLATLSSLDTFTFAIYSLIPVFIASTPPHLCVPSVPPVINCTLEEYHNWAAPTKCTSDGECSPDPCRMYKTNVSMTVSNCSEGFQFDMVDVRETQACTHWSYGDSFYPDNAVREWNLVCDHAVHANNIAGVYMLGRIVGCLIVGPIADTFGRRRAMLTATALTFLFAMASALTTNFYAFLLARFLLAVFSMARYNVSFICGVEFLHSSKRAFFLGYWSVWWAVGSVALAGFAYLIPQWRYLHIACTMPEILIFGIHYLALPETPRWLLLRKRRAEARAFIEKMAKFNKKELPEEWELVAEEKTDVKTTFLDLVKAPCLRLMTMTLGYIFFANCFVFYGLSLNTSVLSGNKYLNFALCGAVELPAYILISLFYERITRRSLFCVCLTAGGVVLLSTLIIPEGLSWLVVVLSMVGKFFITATFCSTWLIVVELFPTAVRGVGLGVTNSAARIASVLSAYVGLLVSVHASLPVVVFSISAILAGVLVLVLPETRGVILPQTVKEAEAFVWANMCKINFCQKEKVAELKVEVEVPLQSMEDI